MLFGPLDEPVPEIDISAAHLDQMLVEIKRNSRNRRIAMIAPVLLVAAVVGAMIAAPPQHGGLALVADAETPDPQLPRVFGSNGVWRLAEPIQDAPADPGPASVVEAPTEGPAGPSFSLSPPDEETLSSLPTSTSTPPMSTSGQSDTAEPPVQDPAELDWSSFRADIRITSADEPAAADVPADADAAPEDSTEPADSDPVAGTADTAGTTDTADTVDSAGIVDPDDATEAQDPTISTPEDSADVPVAPVDDTTTPDDVTVAEDPQNETPDQTEANPSTPTDDRPDAEPPVLSAPASIVPQSVLVYSAHVSVTVQVVDDDSSVIDWCNTRVDWGDGSVTRVAGADDAALCTASCEYSAASSATGISETISFEHDYSHIIDASPRIFVATGDGCNYTLAELQLPPFTVVPLP